MDDRGFDSLTRRTFAVTSRRSAFAGVAGLLAFLTDLLRGDVAAQGRPEVCRPLGEACFPDRGVGCCGNAACRQGRCRCGRKQRACRGSCISKNRCCRHQDCGGGQHCDKRRCQCPAGRRRCGKRCVPKQACCPNETRCQGQCANLQTTKRHCGECGLACAGTATCKQGRCVAGGAYRLVRQWGDGVLDEPRGITVDQSGTLYVANRVANEIVTFTGTGGFITSWSTGSDPTYGVDVAPGGLVYVTHYANPGEVSPFSTTGTPETPFPTLPNPLGLAAGPSGDIYVAIPQVDSVQRFDPNGNLIATWDEDRYGFNLPGWVAVAPNGDVYVSDAGDEVAEVIWLSATGTVKGRWGSRGSGNGQFINPFGITVDAAGFVYVADYGNVRVQKFTASGGFVGIIGGASVFQFPFDVAVSRSGMLYVTDERADRIVQFVPD